MAQKKLDAIKKFLVIFTLSDKKLGAGRKNRVDKQLVKKKHLMKILCDHARNFQENITRYNEYDIESLKT